EADHRLASTIASPEVRTFLLTNLIKEGAELQWRIDLNHLYDGRHEIAAFPELPEAPGYGGPALFIRGGDSPYVRDEHQPLIARSFPTALIEIVPGEGHWVHARNPAAFGELLCAFLFRHVNFVPATLTEPDL
ncbi:MAG: hypothetical protein HQL31_13210, partial [Planctomycetes bacterium]|nr:hypothetical protein [Planctomycetota bacterium]